MMVCRLVMNFLATAETLIPAARLSRTSCFCLSLRVDGHPRALPSVLARLRPPSLQRRSTPSSGPMRRSPGTAAERLSRRAMGSACQLRVDIAYRGRTGDGMLRHPSFKMSLAFSEARAGEL
ncbi:hypothetical protein BQ8482_130050 [Mesorhizobium delmotii]|uniref:Uncharacterized protein n=1 Tax=Mesorhizobium delmotii TaxID=1631247 RepID=A0A2P9AG94_9HYPH|nr:hypothetical protein BQ8482_130050 [Mesorhizobium delmotii]